MTTVKSNNKFLKFGSGIPKSRSLAGGVSFAALVIGAGAAMALDPPPVDPITLLSAITGTGIENIVTITGTSGPSNTPITPVEGYEQVIVELVDTTPGTGTVGITSVKTITSTGTGAGGAYVTGDVITYDIVVTNTGNTWLNDVVATDTFTDAANGLDSFILDTSTAGLTNIVSVSTDIISTTDLIYDQLAPGDFVTYKAVYTVTLADMAAGSADGNGSIANTATVTADYFDGTDDIPVVPIDPPVEVVAVLDLTPSLDILKTDDSEGTPVIAGQTVTYTYVVTNNGTVPIDDIVLADAQTTALGEGTLAVSCVADLVAGTGLTDNGVQGDSIFGSEIAPVAIESLAPLDVLTCTATYLVSQDDIDQLQ